MHFFKKIIKHNLYSCVCEKISLKRAYSIADHWHWAISSAGRAPRLHRGCREFESLIAHHLFLYQ